MIGYCAVIFNFLQLTMFIKLATGCGYLCGCCYAINTECLHFSRSSCIAFQCRPHNFVCNNILLHEYLVFSELDDILNLN